MVSKSQVCYWCGLDAVRITDVVTFSQPFENKSTSPVTPIWCDQKALGHKGVISDQPMRARVENVFPSSPIWAVIHRGMVLTDIHLNSFEVYFSHCPCPVLVCWGLLFQAGVHAPCSFSWSLIRKTNLISWAGETPNTLQKTFSSAGPILQVRKLKHREMKWFTQWLLHRAAPHVHLSFSNSSQGGFGRKK